MEHTQKREIFSTVETQTLQNGKPIYVSIDDTEDHFPPVTVKGTYMVHRYEDALNKTGKAAGLLTYPAGSFGKKAALRTYLCSDTALSDEEIPEPLFASLEDRGDVPALQTAFRCEDLYGTHCSGY